MNICFFLSDYPSPTRGGIESITLALYNEFYQKGHSVFILSKDKPKTKEETIEDTHIRTLPNGLLEHPENVKFISDFLKNNKIEFVINQSHHSKTVKLLYSLKVSLDFKIITTFHGNPTLFLKELQDKHDFIKYFSKNKLSSFFKLSLFYLKFPITFYLRNKACTQLHLERYQYSDAYVLLCEDYANWVKYRLHLSVTNKKIFSISNFLLHNEDAEYPCGKKKKIVLFVGRMDFQKRLDRMLRIWQRVEAENTNWLLYVIGDGDVKDLMQNYAHKLGLRNCLFLGKTNAKEYMKEATVLCMTSSHEGYPLTLMEAQKFGCLPIAFDSFASVKTLLTDKVNGILIPPFDEKAYSKTLSDLLNDETLIQTLSKNLSVVSDNKEFFVNKWLDIMSTL